MNFYIQTSTPHILSQANVEDNTLSDAIESIFPMYTEELIMFWNHIGIPLSYKYDVSYMIDDILMILQHIQTKKSGELIIHWLPDTFRTDWKIEWQEEIISIYANWENLKGDLQEILINSPQIEIQKNDFMCEWKMLLKLLISALKQNGYDLLINKQYDMLVKRFINIKEYGVLYRNVRYSQ